MDQQLSELQIEIIRSARRTISLRMKPGAVLEVRVPLRMSQKAVMDEVARHRAWIAKQLEKQKQLTEILNGAGNASGGGAVFGNAAGGGAAFGKSTGGGAAFGNAVGAGAAGGILSAEELKALKKRARQVFLERTAHYAPLVGVGYGNITVRIQKSRFGSCSKQGNLNFNAALLLAPPEVLDYVVVHELCHRLHMDHSRAFWKEVERVCPSFKSCKRWLRENGSLILARCGAL